MWPRGRLHGLSDYDQGKEDGMPGMQSPDSAGSENLPSVGSDEGKAGREATCLADSFERRRKLGGMVTVGQTSSLYFFAWLCKSSGWHSL